MNETTTNPIGRAEVLAAAERLRRYRTAKQSFDARVCEETLWWQSRHGSHASPAVGIEHRSGKPATSAWLFSSVSHKHADLCDAMPTCSVLPREPGDEVAAEMLTKILPVIADRCELDRIYAANAWSKLKHGVAAYGVFWNPALENGLGDVDVRRVDVLNLFWAPHVESIQESPHLFLVALEDTDVLLSRYPALASRREAADGDATDALWESGGSYLFGSADTAGKSAVVDWYYKSTRPDGRTVVHYAKFTGETLLYASENDPALAERGWYDHGQYPFVLDVMYPEEGSAVGYGLIAVGRQPQAYVDELDGHLLEYANWASRVRYWAKRSLGVNEKDFLDPNKRIVEVEGDIDEEKLRQITTAPMDGALAELRRMKVDELKETTGSRDVSTGGSVGGVTAAAAITALQEAGHKTSRDCIEGSYRAYVQIICQIMELIRQFYDTARTFRIAGDGAGKPYAYVRYEAATVAEREVGKDGSGEPLYYRPVFDIEVRAEQQSPHSRAEHNELMLRLFEAGMLDEGRETAALRALSAMQFDGVESLCSSLRGDREVTV